MLVRKRAMSTVTSSSGKVYKVPSITVDGLVVRKNVETEKFQILLIERAKDPFKGKYALPGGFVDYGEDPMEAVKRELKEETHADISNLPPKLITVKGKPDRDPRGHTISIAYCVKIDEKSEIKADDDAAAFVWKDLDSIQATQFAFDHSEIMQEFVQWFEKEGKQQKYYVTQ